MARWNETVILLSPAEKYQDSTGAWHEGRRPRREVFCNEFTISTVQMAHLRSSDIRMTNTTQPVDVGLRHEHMLQMRRIDYEGEDQVIYHGEEYEVIYASGGGEMIYLTIGQRMSNAVEDE